MTLRAVLFLGVLALGGCREATVEEKVVITESAAEGASVDWLMTRGGKELQGRVQAAAPANPKVLWTFAMEGPGAAEAGVTEEDIFVGDAIGNFYAIDRKSQAERWKFLTDGSILAAPAISEELVVVASTDATVYALDRLTGEKQWSFEGEDKFTAGPMIQESPEGKEEWVLINCYDGTAHCLRLADGSVVWSYNTGNFLNGSSALVNEELVVFGGCDATIYGVNFADGEAAHQVETEAQITNSGATWGTVMYCGNHASQVVAADVVQEKILWTYEAGEFPFEAAPALDEKHVYIGAADKNLHAIDRATGAGGWKFRTGGSVLGAPLAFDDAIVFGSKDGRLYAVDSTAGEERWSLDLGESLAASPAFSRGQIIVAGDDGTVFVVGEK